MQQFLNFELYKQKDRSCSRSRILLPNRLPEPHQNDADLQQFSWQHYSPTVTVLNKILGHLSNSLDVMFLNTYTEIYVFCNAPYSENYCRPQFTARADVRNFSCLTRIMLLFFIKNTIVHTQYIWQTNQGTKICSSELGSSMQFQSRPRDVLRQAKYCKQTFISNETSVT
jgi:hypothetical protein